MSADSASGGGGDGGGGLVPDEGPLEDISPPASTTKTNPYSLVPVPPELNNKSRLQAPPRVNLPHTVYGKPHSHEDMVGVSREYLCLALLKTWAKHIPPTLIRDELMPMIFR